MTWTDWALIIWLTPVAVLLAGMAAIIALGVAGAIFVAPLFIIYEFVKDTFAMLKE